MDTYMDTKILIVYPLHILQFIIGDNIVSSKDWSRFMTWDGHDGEMIVSGKPQIIDRTIPKIMDGEVSKLWRKLWMPCSPGERSGHYLF